MSVHYVLCNGAFLCRAFGKVARFDFRVNPHTASVELFNTDNSSWVLADEAGLSSAGRNSLANALKGGHPKLADKVKEG